MNYSKIQLMEQRLQQTFSPSFLQVIDESDLHIGHAGHQGGGRHFSIIIAAETFQNLSAVDAHKKIYAVFDDMIPHEIHALKIKIKR